MSADPDAAPAPATGRSPRRWQRRRPVWTARRPVDAFAEITPEIAVAFAPEEVAADLILFCAGRTAPTGAGPMVSRHELAAVSALHFYEGKA